jgi:hypothetical protein
MLGETIDCPKTKENKVNNPTLPPTDACGKGGGFEKMARLDMKGRGY